MRIHGNKLNKITFDLKRHFIQNLGWDKRDVEFLIVLEKEEIEEKIICIAEKRGLCIYLSRISDKLEQVKLIRSLNKLTYENVVLFAKENEWKWCYKDKFYIVPTYYAPPIVFTLGEEENLLPHHVTDRVHNFFDNASDFKKVKK